MVDDLHQKEDDHRVARVDHDSAVELQHQQGAVKRRTTTGVARVDHDSAVELQHQQGAG
jgi:hypothetical protein